MCDKFRNFFHYKPVYTCKLKNGLKQFLEFSCAVRFICASFSTVLYLFKMPRRNRIPIEHRERIVCAFEDEAEDYLLVAVTLGVNHSTARGIVA